TGESPCSSAKASKPAVAFSAKWRARRRLTSRSSSSGRSRAKRSRSSRWRFVSGGAAGMALWFRRDRLFNGRSSGGFSRGAITSGLLPCPLPRADGVHRHLLAVHLDLRRGVRHLVFVDRIVEQEGVRLFVV